MNERRDPAIHLGSDRSTKAQGEIVAPSPALRKLFGTNMRSLRLAKHLSQEKFADVCNLHRTYIGAVERGEVNISIDNMERIAAALGTTVADMLRTTIDNPKATPFLAIVFPQLD